ncbi:MAG: sorbosone dehydrogenase [Mesorhizobium amorphae]|nr:MAG: sorbosone dehydrogenase [Mesorhizobium amorphae]
MHPNFVRPNLSDERLARPASYRMLIGGKSVDARSGKRITRESPGHRGAVVGSWPEASSEDVADAIQAARHAFDHGPWPRMAAAERSALMFRVADLIERELDALALVESLEVGKPLTQARGEIGFCADLWRYAAGQARGQHGDSHNDIGENRLGLVLREPVGVVGIITPWNFPFIIASERVPWALGAGNTVVLKPSELTSGTSVRLGELAREAGIPDGVFNVVTGYGAAAGQPFAEDPRTDMVAFTGSVRVGTHLAALAAPHVKRVGLELGGKGPQIVFADADLDAAADGIAYGVYHNAGQCCISGSRLLVEESVRDDLLARVLTISRKVPFGDPLGETTRIGAMISEAHLDKVATHVRDGEQEGAELLTGGAAESEHGLYFQPTVFQNVRPDMRIAREEIFGPVLSTIGFKTADEAVALANDSDYGLSATVWSQNLENAMQTIRRVRAGRCWVNSVIDGTPELPVGGYKKSGLGRELGRYGFDEYTQIKGIHITLGQPARWFEG